MISGGAQTGYAGYADFGDDVCLAFDPPTHTNIQPEQVGASNADKPAYRSVFYNTTAAPGSRITYANQPTSKIARMYHSRLVLASPGCLRSSDSVSVLSAITLPNGSIMIAGSNPNDLYTQSGAVPYPTEYRVEYLNPLYMAATRPIITTNPASIQYGAAFTLKVTLPLPTASSRITVALMDL